MSDEFPPPAQRAEDELVPAEPDESGYGYYEVEEYSGDPAARPVDPDPIAPEPVAPFASPQSVAPSPPTRPFAPPMIGLEKAAHEAPEIVAHSATHDDDVDGEAWPEGRSGRVPFGDRNWRLPLIAFLGVAIVVLGATILLLPDGGIEQRNVSEFAEIRSKPVKQWDEDLDGFASAATADETSMYIVVAKPTAIELVSFDLNTGDERWSTDLGPGDSTGTGRVAIVEEGLVVVFNPAAGANGSVVSVDPETGTIRWQGPAGHPLSTVVTGSVVAGPSASAFELTALDDSKKRLGATIRANAFFVGDRDEDGDVGVIYVDNGGVLTAVDATTLESVPDFQVAHSTPIVAPVAVDGGLVFGQDNEIVRVTDDGTKSYSFDPEIGRIETLVPMSGDQVAVSGSSGTRVVSLDDDKAEFGSNVRLGSALVRVVETDGEEFVAVFDRSTATSDSGVLSLLRRVDDSFETVSELDTVSPDVAPELTVAGATGYITSSGASPLFVAFDLITGERLWGLAMLSGDVATLTSDGVLVLAREDDESVVTYHAPPG